MSRSRRLGSFSRHFFNRRCIERGTPSHRGSAWITAARIVDTSSPTNGLLPVSIS
jgi:hypothetical protein